MTITLTREEAQQVFHALKSCSGVPHWPALIPVIELLRARLSAPEPEPQEVIAKWIKTNTEHREWYICPKCSHQTPRFKDEWQGLTDEEVGMLTVFDGLHHVEVPLLADYARAIEAKLKEKNA
jgi:hypothetical protein